MAKLFTLTRRRQITETLIRRQLREQISDIYFLIPLSLHELLVLRSVSIHFIMFEIKKKKEN